MENPNFHKIAKERQNLRGDLLERSGKDWQEHKKTWNKEDGFSGVAEAIEAGDIFSFMGGKDPAEQDPDAHIKNRLTELDGKAAEFKFSDKNQMLGIRNERAVEKKQHENFEKISQELYVLEKIQEANLRTEFNVTQRSKGEFSEADKERLRQLAAIGQSIEKRKSVLRENSETHLFCRMHDLKHVRQEMTDFGFSAMESQQKDAAWVRKRWEEGNAVLLEGPTGTGKTELLNYMAKKLYKASPEVLRCTERTGPAEIFGKTLLKSSESGGTETFFQPGRYTTAIDRGKPILMDEFNQLPTNMRFSLKELYNRKAGDHVVIQEDTGKPHEIKRGFAWGATANIKSGKHKERFDLDGAESRVFDMRSVGYMPADEIYDLSLASLMDKNCGVPLGANEAKETLKFLIDASKEIQKGYAEELGNHYGMTNTRGEKPVLEKAVLDPGSVLKIVSGYKTEAVKGVEFLNYLDERLLDFVSKGDYPERDRELMIRILMSKGFFQKMPAAEFRLKALTEDALKPFRSTKKEKEEVEKEKYLTLEQLAVLDPYGKRAQFFAGLGDEFLEGTERHTETILPGELSEQIKMAQEMMERGGKEFFLGPDDLGEAFGFKLEAKDVPPIPFSREEIELHQKLGDMLVLNIDRTPEGLPLTIEEMAERAIKNIGSNVIEKDTEGNPTKYLLYNDQFDESGKIKSGAWFSGEDEIRKQTPRVGWQFVSPNILPDSTNKNYLAQTELLIKNAKGKFFNNNFPLEYQNAEEEFNQKKAAIAELVKNSKYVEVAKELSVLKISQLLREPLQNTILRYLVSFKKGKQLFTDGKYSWSSGVSSGGFLLDFGLAAAYGADVFRSRPDGSVGRLGVVSSRW